MKTTWLFSLYFLGFNVCAQSWTQINTLPDAHYIALEKDNDRLYASTNGNLVYISSDNGNTWEPSVVGPSTIQLTSFAIFDHQLFAGTHHSGAFISTNQGLSWTNTGSGMPGIYAFTKWRNNIYTCTLGNGVYVFDSLTHHWAAFNNGLPDYSANVFDLVNANDTLMIAAGANGTYYFYDPTTSAWDEKYYFSILKPGLLITDLAHDNGKILAVSAPRIFYTSNNGLSWPQDTTGFIQSTETDAWIEVGQTFYYAAINERLTGGTWIQRQNKFTNINGSWENLGDFIPSGYTYSVKEIDDQLFLCRNDGVFYMEIIENVPVTENPQHIQLFPNPSTNGNITVESNEVIHEIFVFGTGGKMVLRIPIQNKKAHLDPLPKGMYLLKIITATNTVNKRLIIE